MNEQEANSARWKRIDDLLDAAFDLAPDQRPAFLDQACAGDEALKKEIERLLASDEHAGSFIESPAFQNTSEPTGTSNLLSLIRGDTDHESLLRTGQLVAGRYEILSRLGKGGMGEVWHAYDLKLRADVALKSIRVDLNRSPDDKVALIRHEIRAAREVISPNVCRIFDLVSEGNHELISMEYIDGTTLLEMMEQKGPIDLGHAREIAAQFLAGLEVIHAAGLVHRDFKPENIMITRTGRVVVMDLGIAEQSSKSRGIVSGTLPYMSPEQIAGEEIDSRSDIYSAGLVLAEMIHTKGMESKSTREILWKAVREDPMQLPDSPWKTVIARAVSANKENRFPSAMTLARALEEITLRLETVEDRNPYPGLLSFTSDNTEYFFGREQEVEALFQKLEQLHLTALIGPSGAGKTSFIRAGLIPVLPKDWLHAVTIPGDAPSDNLAQSLAPMLSADPEAVARMIHFEDPDVAIWILTRLRKLSGEFLLIIDRFEELFTLNSFHAQSKFVDILRRATLEANIRILLVLRDDFLIFCKEHQSLAPVFSELTPMLPLRGADLRRALVQPALKCGYRFEDESLVHDILSEVEKETGVLPLMAFATSLMWEKRDREQGVLTREAYSKIGEVQGALAQHAENIMRQIGDENEPVAREIFRNLITAQNTRIARDKEELLSVFRKPEAAEKVLSALIDGRLLTSFVMSPIQNANSRRRIEISHESLITHWPRLVRWQTQDAENAQFRDHLRQASQVWKQRGQSADLLWSGSAFLEFQLWRQRYPGGLTTTEEQFAQAMGHHANKRRRQRQSLVTTVFVALLLVVAVLAYLWRQATIARNEARTESKLAQASKILAIGRAVRDSDPTTKLAYAIASLEFADTPQARRFALQALFEGPPAQAMEFERHTAMELSPDGKWIAVGRTDGGLDLISEEGSTPISLQQGFKPNHYVQWKPQFSPDGKLLIWTWRGDTRLVNVWSFAEKKIIRTFHLEGLTMCLVRGGKAFFITDSSGRLDTPLFWGPSVARIWNMDHNEPEIIGHLTLGGNWKSFDISPDGHMIAFAKEKGVYIRSLDESGIGPEKIIGQHSSSMMSVRFHPGGNEVVSVDDNGELKLWTLYPAANNPVRTITRIGGTPPFFDQKGRYLFAPRDEALVRWELNEPEAEPLLYRSPYSGSSGIVDPKDRWLAVQTDSTLAFYSLAYRHPYIYSDRFSNVRITPDGKSLIGARDNIYMWSMPGEKPTPPQTLWKMTGGWSPDDIDLDSTGKRVLFTTGNAFHLITLPDRNDHILNELPRGDPSYEGTILSPDGKTAAVIRLDHIEIWDLQSGKSRMLKQSQGKLNLSMKFSPDGTLYSGCGNMICSWNLKNDSAEILVRGKGNSVRGIAISNNGRYLAAIFSSAKNIFDFRNSVSDLVLYDFIQRKASTISSHGNRVIAVAFDRRATKLVTGDLDGIVRVGPISGEAPHLLLGHLGGIGSISVHPNGKWIATSADTLRLWQMPEGKPLDSLPYPELLARLRAITNLRAVVDESSPTGYRTKVTSFAGWKKALKEAEFTEGND